MDSDADSDDPLSDTDTDANRVLQVRFRYSQVYTPQSNCNHNQWCPKK